MTIVIDTEIIELFTIQCWHLQCKFAIKVFVFNIQRGLFPKELHASWERAQQNMDALS